MMSVPAPALFRVPVVTFAGPAWIWLAKVTVLVLAATSRVPIVPPLILSLVERSSEFVPTHCKVPFPVKVTVPPLGMAPAANAIVPAAISVPPL